ncbi:unnamed protein product [Fraxinus pennsylvanica]|uniref:Uncharacterized protein n=1 Tax=Fraxinus pennsylvanica TaxID=56036 RepID=A0AAD1ZAV7_9LAMI|nr:unnamed protein product [Fraxinus pennsylvanica]
MSNTLSGQTEKGLGFGGLKLGGCDIEKPELGSSLMLTEVEAAGVSEEFVDDCTKKLLFCWTIYESKVPDNWSWSKIQCSGEKTAEMIVWAMGCGLGLLSSNDT